MEELAKKGVSSYKAVSTFGVIPLRFVISTLCITTLLVQWSHAAHPVNIPVTMRAKEEGRSLAVPLALSYQQIVLEQKIGTGWKPIAVEYPRSLKREEMRHVSFGLPPGLTAADLRVQGYRAAKFPARFIYGKKFFSRLVAAVDREVSIEMGHLDRDSEKGAGDPLKGKSGLWQITNNQLFFFNQFRGLQVIDLGDPTHPLRTGSLRLPATGDQMFVLDEAGTQVLLLGRSNGKERPGGATLYLLGIADGVPTLTGELPLTGQVVDSRLIGTQLYLLSVTKDKDAAQSPKTLLTKVELGGKEAPKMVGKTAFPGVTPTFQVQGTKLLVSVKEGNEARLHEVVVEGAQSLDQRLVSRQDNLLSGYEVLIDNQILKARNTQDAQEPATEMPMTWRTDRVLPVGDMLVQLEDGRLTDDVSGRLRVTPANDPDVLVEELDLGAGCVVGFTQKNDVLFIAQWVPAVGEKQSVLRTWALDLQDPSSVVELGSVEHVLPGFDAWDLALDKVQPLWVNSDTLVWFMPAQHHPRLWWSCPIPVRPVKPTESDLIPVSSTVAMLCPVSFAKDRLSEKKSQILRVKGCVTQTSQAVIDGGLVYFSHDTTDLFRTPTDTVPPLVKVPLRLPSDHLRSWLQVVDFRPAEPILRNAVSIPGQLLGVTQSDAQGAVLLSQSDLVLRREVASIRLVHASAYDGVNAYQLDTYITATAFGSATVVEGNRVYMTQQTGRVGVVAIAYQSSTGRLAKSASWNTHTAPEMLHVIDGHLLASSHGNLEVASIAAETGKLTPLATYDTPVDLWLPVNRSAMTPTQDIWVPAGDYGVELLQKQALGQ